MSVVVPCFNEEQVIAAFHTELSAQLQDLKLPYEIVFVDDGSKDATLTKLREFADRDHHVRYLALSRNFGKEAAMLAGLRESAGDSVVIMDADLQHPPSFIKRMLDLRAQGFDQVIARRTRDHDGRMRTFLSRGYYKLINAWADVELADGAGDFRLLSRRAVDALLEMGERNRFSKGLFSWIGFETVTFDYQDTPRADGESKWGMRKLLNYAVDGLVSFNSRPLRLAIHTGLLLSGAALLYALWTVGAVLIGGVTAPGYVTLLVAITGFGGIQMVMLGLIGEYIGRVYYETKQRPHYLVRERTPSDAAQRSLPTAEKPVSTTEKSVPADETVSANANANPQS
ncbi:glycosyltransferase family 2 protein [Streptomyces sp. URMC 123]|uniref:glycosyltransferase family 2 protein n=1 Tax=Streptomyces sp. URMC 123 TaxID=3423403 RepID=UPI003F19D86B